MLSALLHHLVPQGIALLGQFLHLSGVLGHGVEHIQGCGQLIDNLGNEDGDRLVKLGLNLRYLVIELIQRQNCLGMGCIQIKCDFLGGRQGVNHVGNGPDAIEAIKAVQRLGGIGHADGHPVTLADAHFVQSFGRGLNAAHKLGIGGFLTHKGIGNMVRLPLCRLLHQLVHGGMGIVNGGGGIAVIFQPGGGGG